MSPRLRKLGGLDTGFPASDAQTDFSRARRERALARLTARLRRESSDFDVILPFEEVLAALGRAGQRSVGLQSIPLDSIVGTVDRRKEFDRRFRPTSGRVRGRWERIAEVQRRGGDMPPISAYRIGDLHFVKDGHHRVSVARAQGRTHIDGHVTEVQTRLPLDSALRAQDLPLKGHERLFYERVPLTPDARRRVRPSDPWDYGCLAEGVEAWGLRAIQARGEFMTREEVAEGWYRDDYLPVVKTLREAGLADDSNETDVYMRVVSERYRLMRTHEWSEEILTELRPRLGGSARPSRRV
jgi:hypothetical protein